MGTMNSKGRILIVDDHKIIYIGIKMLGLSKLKNYIFDYASDGTQCIERIRKNNYNLILLDIIIPNTDTQNLFQLIINDGYKNKVLIFSQNPEEIYAQAFLKMGALGYLKKDAEDIEIVNALQTVLEGKNYFSPATINLLANNLRNGSLNNFDSLSPRELEIMNHLIKGKKGKEIGTIMNIKSSTVGTYKARIYKKLNVSNVIELKDLVNAQMVAIN